MAIMCKLGLWIVWSWSNKHKHTSLDNTLNGLSVLFITCMYAGRLSFCSVCVGLYVCLSVQAINFEVFDIETLLLVW